MFIYSGVRDVLDSSGSNASAESNRNPIIIQTLSWYGLQSNLLHVIYFRLN